MHLHREHTRGAIWSSVNEITILNNDDIGRVAALLAAAFDDDVGFDYVFRTPSARRRWEKTILGIATRLAMNHGIATGARIAARADLSAVALWYPPQRPFPPPWYRILIPALRLTPMVLEYSMYRRYESLYRLYLSLMPRGCRLLYLAGLAVERDCRGQRLGTQLVQWGQEYAVGKQSAVFLQCWTALVPYYERLGFTQCSEGTLPGIADTCHGLLWEP